MLAAASAKKNSHPELLHHKYCKAALSGQQSGILTQPGLSAVEAERRSLRHKDFKAEFVIGWHDADFGERSTRLVGRILYIEIRS